MKEKLKTKLEKAIIISMMLRGHLKEIVAVASNLDDRLIEIEGMLEKREKK